MFSIGNKSRDLHILPGRIRLSIIGLKGSIPMAELLLKQFSQLNGIQKIEPSILTGRLLLVFDENCISTQQILHIVHSIEAGSQEIAVTSESKRKAIPLPLALSMGGLAVLGAKRIFWGQSTLAKSALPFYLSGLVSVLSGYPFLKRGVKQFSQDSKFNFDLLLGTSALALALVRENVVVLAGLSILQYINWQRSQTELELIQNVYLSPEIEAYSHKASKWGMIAAGTTLAVTRDPLRAIAILLAANPRPATILSEFTWNQAELVAHEQKYPIPKNGSLAQLSRTKTILLEDTTLLFEEIERVHGIECMSNEKDTDKIICLAGSLMEKSNHPWKKEVCQKAQSTCRTMRTAYHVEEKEHGIKGRINDSEVLLGTLAYLQQYGVSTCDQYLIEENRLRRKGFDVLFVAKQINKTNQCLGLLIKQRQITTEYNPLLKRLAEKDWKISFLQDSINIRHTEFPRYELDYSWLSCQEGEIIEKIAAMNQQGKEVLFVAANETSLWNGYLKTAGVPTLFLHQMEQIMKSSDFALAVDQTVNLHFRLTKQWNIWGTLLAAFGMISAPVTNLMADALSLVFLSRSKQVHEDPVTFPFDQHYIQEAAVTSEAIAWHTESMEQALNHHKVDEQWGCTTDQVLLSRQRFGMNQLEGRKTTPFFIAYLAQFKEFTTLILLGTSVFALFTGGLFDGIAMGSILLVNAAIGTFQERKAEKVVETLNHLQPHYCKVIREGKQVELSATQLVPGDIVHLEAGNRIPADLRLLRTWNLQVSEAALTGESLPVDKYESAIEQDIPLPERNNMLYMGTDVCRGKCVAIVVKIGMDTEMGHLVALLKSEEKEVTPLQEKITSISKTFVKGALIAGGVVFLAGLLRGIPITEMITTSVILAASAIPEGLPVTITIALSAGIFRMAKKNALIRKLSALETLGRTTVICTDKTGTLTKNEMTVKAIATIDRLWSVTGNGYEPIGNIEEMVTEEVAASSTAILDKELGIEPIQHPELQRLLQIGLLCNNSTLHKQEDHWIIKGDPTEGALLTLAAKAALWQHDMPRWHRGVEVPFDSNTGKMSVVCKDSETINQQCFVFSKGALETIIRYCSYYQLNGEIRALTDDHKQIIMQQNEKLASDALRVLGFAYRPINDHEHEKGLDEKEMIYVGMVGMIDPPKSEVELNIREAFELGVKPVMITGDHPITAIAIAKQLGIYDGTQKVLSGHELQHLTEEELIALVDDISIFARVTPEHKLRIVAAFQKRGHIVAMTGDGVNDTPAIKQANIGIAMGLTGTEVTKQTAVMVLKEDHFGSIIEGVKEGRTIISNIRKALGCLLTGNLAEILVTSAAVIIGLPIPFVPIQILLMNLLTDALPAMILAVNPGNKTKQTKRVDIVDKELYQKVVSKGVLLGLGSLGLYAASLAAGAPIAVAQSVAFATLVSGQLIQTFSWRQEGTEETAGDWSKDRFLIGALGISCLALLTALYVPGVSGFFHTAPLSLKYWLPILLVAGSISFFSKTLLSLISTISVQPMKTLASESI
ncbi:MAG: family hydrolase [Bacilli bacterium]|nr:family hydrolase [Bacilli bacterium]